MRCIFCKKSSEGSKSVEHIIPESLGNENHVLPAGVVCDACNNYFSRKVEGPLFDLLYFRTLRSEEFILSKRGRPAQVPAILTPGPHPVQLAFPAEDESGSLSIVIPNERDWAVIENHFQLSNKGAFYIPACPDQPPIGTMGRFLAKVAVEAMALRLVSDKDNLNAMIDDGQIDLIRTYARFGKGPQNWPYSQRVIYPRDKTHTSESGQEYQMVHEFDFLFTKENECYFVLAIFGVEYVINMAGPSIEAYMQWLKENNEKSPLYCYRDRDTHR